MPTDQPPQKKRSPRRQPASAVPGAATLTPDEFARALRAIAGELERNPELARRVSEAMHADAASAAPTSPIAHDTEAPVQKPARAFRPRVIEGARPDLGPGVPDPFALRARLGEAGLRAALDELHLGSLRAIVREHHLDPTGKAMNGSDAERLRRLILRATDKSAPQR